MEMGAEIAKPSLCYQRPTSLISIPSKHIKGAKRCQIQCQSVKQDEDKAYCTSGLRRTFSRTLKGRAGRKAYFAPLTPCGRRETPPRRHCMYVTREPRSRRRQTRGCEIASESLKDQAVLEPSSKDTDRNGHALLLQTPSHHPRPHLFLRRLLSPDTRRLYSSVLRISILPTAGRWLTCRCNHARHGHRHRDDAAASEAEDQGWSSSQLHGAAIHWIWDAGAGWQGLDG